MSAIAADLAFIDRSLKHSLRNSEALLMAVMLPAMLMVLFTYVFGGAIDPTGNYVDYVVPGIILLCAGFGAASTAIEVSTDMSTGVIDRFRAMPIRAWGVLTGHVVASLLRNLFATALVFAIAVALGFRPTASVAGWFGAIGMVALWILAITWLFAAIGLVASSPDAANAYGFILLFLPYVSSAFVPVASMPTWLQWFADHQPVTPIIETIRGLLMGTPMGSSPAWALGWTLAIIAGAIVWAVVAFSRRRAR